MPPQAARLRAVLYLRLSDSDDASTSIKRQDADTRARCDREDWDVVEVLVDDGISGQKTREKAERALAMLRNEDADVLVVWKFDRWSRQGLSSVAALIDTLDATPGSIFVADRDGLDSRQPAWRIVAAVLAEVAREEAKNTALRVTSSIARLRTKEARFAGGTVPYGYRTAPKTDGEGRVLVVDQAEAKVINEAADRVLNGEASYRVCIDFNERGIPSPRSEHRRLARAGRDTTGADRGTWRVSSFRRLLTGRHLLGQQVHDGEPLRDENGLPATVWPPILKQPDGSPDVAKWRELRARLLAAPGGRVAFRRRRARLLSGLAWCDPCGGKLHVGNTKATKTGTRYRCSRKASGAICPDVAVSSSLLEDYVLAQVRAKVGAWPVIEKRVVVTSSATEDLGEIEDAIRDTTAALGTDDADVPALLGRLESLKARRAEVRALPETTKTFLVPTGQTYAEALDAAESDEERRAILEKVVDRVRVRKGRKGKRTLDTARVSIDFREDIPTDLVASYVLGAMLREAA